MIVTTPTAVPTTIAIEGRWSAVNLTTGSLEQEYNVLLIRERPYLYIPYMLLAVNQKGRITFTITNRSSSNLRVEVGGVVFFDGLDPVVWIGTEGTQSSESMTFAGKTQSYNPQVVNISANSMATVTTKDLFLYNAIKGIVKDGTAFIKIRIKDADTGTFLGEGGLKFVIVSVASDEPLRLGGPHIPTLDITHVSVVEGFFAPFVSNVYGALSSLLNKLGAQDVVNTLSRQFDANITGYVAVTSMNGRGERIPKLLVLFKEASPIAPIAVIIAVIAGLALAIGLIFAVGYLIQVQSTASIAQPVAASIKEKDEIVNKVLQDPNLTPEQKTELVTAIGDYYTKLADAVDKTTTAVRKTEPLPPIGGGGLDLGGILTPLVMILGLGVVVGLFSDLGKK